MKGNLHVRFLEEWEGAIPPSYSAIFTDIPIRAYPHNPCHPCAIGDADGLRHVPKQLS
jgi:hypothetical protein